MKKREDSFTCGIADGLCKSKPHKEVDPSEKVVLDGCSHALPDDSDSRFGAGLPDFLQAVQSGLSEGLSAGSAAMEKDLALSMTLSDSRVEEGRDVTLTIRAENPRPRKRRFADAESAGAFGGADGGRTDVECGASGCSGGRNGRVCAVP